MGKTEIPGGFNYGCAIAVKSEKEIWLIGGYGSEDRETVLDSVELYNTETEKWEMADFKLSKANSIFSFLTVKLGDIISNL